MSFTRREFLEASAGAGAVAALGWVPSWPRAADLITRRIPSSGEAVPIIGIGMRNYRVGPDPAERAPYLETVRAFVRLGGKVFDTAPSYGNSESVLGDILTELEARESVFIATKVDRVGRAQGLERMEASFSNIRTDRLDLMQVHNLRDTETQLASIRELQAAGRVRYVGVTTSSESQYASLEDLMMRETLDFIQVDYALDNRSAGERILPLAQDRGMAVLVNLPFGRGRLFRAVGERALPDWAADIDCTSWAQIFLKYIVSHPAVTCAIPGTTKEHHAVDNIGAAQGRLPDAAMRRRLEQFIDAS